MDKVLLSTTYFGPVQWYQKIYRYKIVAIEQYEYFLKQTYRNRCVIPTTNGEQSLTIPVEKFEHTKCLIPRCTHKRSWQLATYPLECTKISLW